MTWVAAGSAVLGYMSADKAAGAQSAAADRANETQRYMYDQTRADNAPFRETGLEANNKLAYLLGIGKNPTASSGGGGGIFGGIASQIAAALPNAGGAYTPQPGEQYGSLLRKFSASDLNSDPVYQSGLKFGLDQGTQGINRQAAAGGSFLSGATLKALTKYGNDYGSTKANEAYNRFNTDQNAIYNKLAGVSGAGQQATNQVSAAGANMANNVSANQIGAGNANASGYMGQANAVSGGLNSWLNYNQNKNMLNTFANRGGYQYAGGDPLAFLNT